MLVGIDLEVSRLEGEIVDHGYTISQLFSWKHRLFYSYRRFVFVIMSYSVIWRLVGMWRRRKVKPSPGNMDLYSWKHQQRRQQTLKRSVHTCQWFQFCRWSSLVCSMCIATGFTSVQKFKAFPDHVNTISNSVKYCQFWESSDFQAFLFI